MQEEYTGSRVIDRLRASIEQRSESVAAFARFSGIPYRSLQDYLGGKSKPGFEQLAKLACAGLDVGYVLTGFPTGAVDHPSPYSIEPLWMSDGTAVVGRSFLNSTIAEVNARADRGLDLKAWLDVWDSADREVMSAEVAGAEPSRRQAVVFALATDIARGVTQRLAAEGRIGLPAGLPAVAQEG